MQQRRCTVVVWAAGDIPGMRVGVLLRGKGRQGVLNAVNMHRGPFPRAWYGGFHDVSGGFRDVSGAAATRRSCRRRLR